MTLKPNPIEEAKQAIEAKNALLAHRILLPILTEMAETEEEAGEELLVVLAALAILDAQTFGTKT